MPHCLSPVNATKLIRSERRIYKNQSGFTLLELMLVVFLIGLAASMVVLTLPDNPHKVAIENSKKLETYLTELSYLARMKGQVYGLYVSQADWQFFHYQPQQKRQTEVDEAGNGAEVTDRDPVGLVLSGKASDWVVLNNNRSNVAIAHPLADGAHFELQLGSEGESVVPITLDEISNNDQMSQPKPQIWILPSGEITPFTLTFLDSNNQIVTTLGVDLASNISPGIINE